MDHGSRFLGDVAEEVEVSASMDRACSTSGWDTIERKNMTSEQLSMNVEVNVEVEDAFRSERRGEETDLRWND